jgi:hypothetical protein
MANRQGTRWRGKIPVPQHVHPTVREFFRLLNAEKTTLTEVGQRGGFRRRTLSAWRYNREPRVSNLDAALNVMGYELVVRRRRDVGP